MQIVYLPNGTACYLKEKIGNKYVINKIYEFEDEEYGIQETIDDQDIIVDKVYNSKPTEKIDYEIKELQVKKESLNKEIEELISSKRVLKTDIERITKTQIDNKKFIINRTEIMNAKTLALFPQRSTMPLLLDGEKKNFRGLKVNFEIQISNGEERKWGYKLYYDYGNDYGQYLCEKYGILINPTEEEIANTIRKRLSEIKFDDYAIAATDDKYLTEDLLKIKKNYLKEKNEKEVENLKRVLRQTQEKLDSITLELINIQPTITI